MNRFLLNIHSLIPTLLLLFLMINLEGKGEERADFLKNVVGENNCTTDTCQINSLNNRAFELKNSNTDLAIQLLDSAEVWSQRIDYAFGLANSLHLQGQIHWNKSEYQDAAEAFFEAMSIREQIDDPIGLARSYNNAGTIYLNVRAFAKAEDMYQKSYLIRREIRDEVGVAYSLNSLAEVANVQGQFQQADSLYLLALNEAETLKNKRAISFFSANYGEFLLRDKLCKRAITYIERSLLIAKEIKLDFAIARAESLLARCYLLKEERLEEAVTLSKSSYEISKDKNAAKVQLMAMKNLAKAYGILENYEEAFKWQREVQQLDISIRNAEQERFVAETIAIREIEEKLNERRSQLDQKYNTIYWVLIIGIVLLFSAFVFSISRQLQSAKRMNRLLRNANNDLQETNNSLESFAYVASHDLKEPLRTIGAFSSVIQKKYGESMGAEGQKYLSFIKNSITRMYSLLDDLLEFTKPIASEKIPINVEQNVREVISGLSKQIEGKNVNIIVGDLPQTIHVFPSTFPQILQNLVSNAIKFNNKDQVIVEINGEETTDMYQFEVKDNGMGIDEAYQEKIFTVFQRLNKQKFDGTGIGLAICKKIIEKHGGRIWLESVPSKGSAFYFSIPKQA